jgi:hypothetical protein
MILHMHNQSQLLVGPGSCGFLGATVSRGRIKFVSDFFATVVVNVVLHIGSDKYEQWALSELCQRSTNKGTEALEKPEHTAELIKYKTMLSWTNWKTNGSFE